jgi:hypothetical protein
MKNKGIILILLILLILFILFIGTITINTTSKLEGNTKNLMFIHIAKNGGTTVEDFFKDNNYLVSRRDKEYEKLMEGTNIPCNFFHIPPKYSDKINFKNYITFCFIRDPVDRIVSEVNFLISSHGRSIDNINTYIKEVLSNKNKFSEDCHIIPQSEYIVDYYGNRIENILNFNDFNNELKKFIDKYKLKIDYSNILVQNPSKKKFKRSDLSDEVLLLIKDYYREDYALINSLKFNKEILKE